MSRLFKKRIECKACTKHLNFYVTDSRAAEYDLNGWLIHKLCCDSLQCVLNFVSYFDFVLLLGLMNVF